MPCLRFLGVERNSVSTAVRADTDRVAKSVPTILILGGIGIGALSLMMQHLADLKTERDRSPYVPAAENALGSRATGPVRIERVPLGDPERGGERLVVRVAVRDGAADRSTADRVGRAVWFGALRAGDDLRELEVLLHEPGAEQPRVFAVARPALGR